MKNINELEPYASSEFACSSPVGLGEVIKESLEFITKYIFTKSDANGQYRKPMLLYSRLARGGKTTTLLALFNVIRNDLKYNCMLISFNGSSRYEHLYGESEVEALYRIVVNQLIDHKKYKGGRIIPDISDWERLDHHIGTTPFVLLIDEMNALCFPVGNEVSKILKTYFLDKENLSLLGDY